MTTTIYDRDDLGEEMQQADTAKLLRILDHKGYHHDTSILAMYYATISTRRGWQEDGKPIRFDNPLPWLSIPRPPMVGPVWGNMDEHTNKFFHSKASFDNQLIIITHVPHLVHPHSGKAIRPRKAHKVNQQAGNCARYLLHHFNRIKPLKPGIFGVPVFHLLDHTLVLAVPDRLEIQGPEMTDVDVTHQALHGHR